MSQITANAAWPPTFGHVVFQDEDELVLLGGFGGNDTWRSWDGIEWFEGRYASPGYRLGYASGVRDRVRQWVIGGIGGGDRYNSTAWYTLDGEAWSLIHGFWTPRFGHAGAYFRGWVWTLGGATACDDYDVFSDCLLNDSWRMADGYYWYRVSPDPPWSARVHHAALVFHDRLWILGGELEDGWTADVWSSPDGMEWTQEPAAPWAPRGKQAAAVYNGRMWIAGGEINHNVFTNDVWSSADGRHWEQFTVPAEFQPRANVAAVTFKGKLFLLGGRTGYNSSINDVWAIDAGCEAVRPEEWHSADSGRDGSIDLSELLRLIQIYNAGNYHCNACSEDGFDVGEGDFVCITHDGDYNPADWRISLSELLRVVQMYNADAYHQCPGRSEDGFCLEFSAV